MITELTIFLLLLLFPAGRILQPGRGSSHGGCRGAGRGEEEEGGGGSGGVGHQARDGRGGRRRDHIEQEKESKTHDCIISDERQHNMKNKNSFITRVCPSAAAAAAAPAAYLEDAAAAAANTSFLVLK